ncbi:ABC transporter substrate-binding protein [Acidiphilium acidophilum]|uniref:ABC transporter substrate-binding protein n=1 Tax=Acidiphilium acidophilum TaxID=76588 RepID=UPI002156A535|nr:ABC transporter substrate-binding protein [Acidiphilium acidophilum]GBQ14200.1 nitrate/sulfonate/bicarbonate ABC transporter substrate-binding periplasmic protein [Acidiphilium acidophilum DSM 700]
MRVIRSIPAFAAALAGLLATLPIAHAAPKLQKVTFGLDWVAEAEYGGYYQAVATGIYKKYGLNVTIREGGPEVNNAQLLLAGKLNFDITSNGFLAFNFVKEHIPFIAVAAMFQKDPDILLAHRSTGETSFAALKGKPIAVSSDTRASWWLFLAHKYHYSDSQLRPYDFNLAPFFTNKNLAVQGFLTSEPFLVKQKTGHYPVVLRLDKAGFDGYAQLVATSKKLVASDPSLVQRFIAASAAGWKSYLDGNPAPAFALIRKANPDMTMPLLKYGYDTLKKDGIVESGDTKTLGIGAMTNARWKGFYDQMRDAGMYPAHFDYKAAYTLQFVDHKGAAKP